MKNLLSLLIPVLILSSFSEFKNKLDGSNLEIIILSDCKEKLKGNQVRVDISKLGEGNIGSVLLNVGNKKGMKIHLQKGKYKLTCSEELGEGLNNFLKTSTSWEKIEVEMDGFSDVRQRLTCY